MLSVQCSFIMLFIGNVKWKCAVFIVLHAVCSFKCVLFSFQCVLCSVQCAVCSVKWLIAMCHLWIRFVRFWLHFPPSFLPTSTIPKLGLINRPNEDDIFSESLKRIVKAREQSIYYNFQNIMQHLPKYEEPYKSEKNTYQIRISLRHLIDVI